MMKWPRPTINQLKLLFDWVDNASSLAFSKDYNTEPHAEGHMIMQNLPDRKIKNTQKCILQIILRQ